MLRRDVARRQFLRMIAGSPLMGFVPTSLAAVERLLDGDEINAPEQAINVMDFEAIARKKLPPAHYGFLSTGVDDDLTVQANRDGFRKLQLRVRRLVNVRRVDASVRLFDEVWQTPIGLAPIGSQHAFHGEGEAGAARAARAKGSLQILSAVASSTIEEVNAAHGTPVWWQLYPTNDWDVSRTLVKRAETAGCKVLVLTLDVQGGMNRESQERWKRKDSRECGACHQPGLVGALRNKPMYKGIDLGHVSELIPLDMDWRFVQKLRQATSMKLVLKGVVTREDAQRAVEHGANGLIVSNHGGRAEESYRATIESLPEVVEGAQGKIPVLIDGGFRRGTDVFKALALGASAVCIGRPYVWGLAAFGQAGVEAVLEILGRELLTVMRQAGTPSVRDIGRDYVVRAG